VSRHSTLGIRSIHLSSSSTLLSYQPFFFRVRRGRTDRSLLSCSLLLYLLLGRFLKQRCLPSSVAAAAQLQPNRLLPKVRSRDPRPTSPELFRCVPLLPHHPPTFGESGATSIFFAHMATQISMRVKKRSWPPFAMNSPLRMPRNS